VKRLVLIALVVAACKQGKGDRCQVNSDCQDGLICSSATGTCSGGTSTGIDATVPADAAVDAHIDAKMADAPKD
jgi:hypothetical protein